MNFWSTTCGPCVAEFPALVDTHRRFQNRPVELITVSLDPVSDRKAVHDFLKSCHAATAPRTMRSVTEEGRTSNNYLYQGNPDDLAKAVDPKWGGALPLTLLVAPGGKIVWRSNAEIEALELRKQIVKLVGPAAASNLECGDPGGRNNKSFLILGNQEVLKTHAHVYACDPRRRIAGPPGMQYHDRV